MLEKEEEGEEEEEKEHVTEVALNQQIQFFRFTIGSLTEKLAESCSVLRRDGKYLAHMAQLH